MRVAIAGAGLFGCTAAIFAARAGHEVHLFEMKPGIMQGASGRCYYRLHRGFHYPRSPETARDSLRSEASFRQEFGASVIDGGKQFYVIAEPGRTNGPDFCFFLDRMNLPYVRNVDHGLITGSDWIFEVEEPRVDLETLTGLLHQKLDGVFIHLNTPLPDHARRQFDAIVVAAYDGSNQTLADLGLPPQPYKFQLVEKPIVRLPKEFKDLSIVVMDGPFGCIDPHGTSDLHCLGHVTKTIHESNVGLSSIPHHDGKTRVNEVIDALARFVPLVREAEYIESVYSIRAVLPNMEATDARPTLVDRLDDQVIRVFSGKLGTAVTAARDVVSMLRKMEKPIRAVA